MGDCDNFHTCALNAINHEKRKARQSGLAGMLGRFRPTLRGFEDFFTRELEFLDEAGCGDLAFVAIPT